MPTNLEVKVTLRGVQPTVRQQFLIRVDAIFAGQHDVIQTACGWGSSHLYLFYGKRIEAMAIAGFPPSLYPARSIHRFTPGTYP